MMTILGPVRRGFARHRSAITKLAFELLIVFVGVTAAFALENVRRQSEESAYRLQIIAALRPTLKDIAQHGAEVDRDLSGKLRAFDEALARGERPRLPIYIERGAEGPPTRIWDSVVATGAARALDADLLFRLARFYSTLDAFGDRYRRYTAVTESRVLGLRQDHADAYDADGALKTEFRAYVEQLRELRQANRDIMRDGDGIDAALEEVR